MKDLPLENRWTPSLQAKDASSLFKNIVGYDDLKEIIRTAIRNESIVHWLFHGPPASAKSMFLLELQKLRFSKLIVGSRVSKAGLHQVLIEDAPLYLLFDELDKAKRSVTTSLLSLMETGQVVTTLKGYVKTVERDTLVFATTNELKNIPRELLSRFQILEFPEYSRSQFMDICSSYVAQAENITVELARYIGEIVWDDIKSKDVRQVTRVARLAKTREAVDLTMGVLKKYQKVN